MTAAPERIWLAPKCHDDCPEGRSWCDHDAWGICDECASSPVEFVRADLAALEGRANG